MNSAATIRFVGDEDFSRRYLLQRRDGKFYTGRGWSARLPKARLTAYENPRRFTCADGGVIAVPDLDGDDETPRYADELRWLAERTECGECRSRGFVIPLAGGKLTFQTVLATDADGTTRSSRSPKRAWQTNR